MVPFDSCRTEYEAIVLNHLSWRYLNLKEEHGSGKLPKDAFAKLFNEAKKHNPWLTRSKVKWHIRKLSKNDSKVSYNTKKLERDAASSSTTLRTLSTLSDLTDPVVDSANFIIVNDSIETGNANEISTTEEAHSTQKDQYGGRPKGTTILAKKKDEFKLKQAKQEATIEYAKAKEAAKQKETRVSPNVISNIIEAAKKKHGIPSSVEIKYDCIRTREKRKIFSLDPKPGGGSPMEVVDSYLVALIHKLDAMRQPITPKECKALANSILYGTSTAAKIVEWKKQRVAACRDGRCNDEELCGESFWRLFKKRHKHLLQSKTAVPFHLDRDIWCNYLNFEEMYNKIYDAMVEKKIAIKTEIQLWRDKDGNVVVSEAAATGLKSEYQLTRPDKLIFVDEVGCNTSQAKDGKVGGEKYLCKQGGRPQIRASTRDAHFTVMCFMAATGEPVMVSIIFAAKNLDKRWVLGVDPFAPCDNCEDIENNVGKGKRYPMGPECVFNNISVPTFCCCSESGSITSDLLSQMLQKMDTLCLFDRSDGVDPFLLLDGHGSRFELPFLEYINNPDHQWNVSIGVPYGTSYWQPADSSEQNGCFKMEMARAKREITEKLLQVEQKGAITQLHATYLVRRSFEASFARVEPNKKSICARGWNPLNYNCLCMDEILRTKPQSLEQTPNTDSSLMVDSIPFIDINTMEGIAGKLIPKIVEQCNRDAAKNNTTINEIRRKRIETAKESMESTKRVTAGILASTGEFVLTGPQVINCVKERKRIAESKELEGKRRKIDEYNKLKNEVDAIRLINLPDEQLSGKSLRILVSWHKKQGDGPLPTRKAELLARYKATRDRGDPIPPTPIVP